MSGTTSTVPWPGDGDRARRSSSSAARRRHGVVGARWRRRRRTPCPTGRSRRRRRPPPRRPRPGRSSSVTSCAAPCSVRAGRRRPVAALRRGAARRSSRPGQNPVVDLPLAPPFKPMLAKLTRTIPDGDGWLYEPKWDGFRCIVFRDGDEIELASRNERPFTRYFPELLDPLRAALPGTLRRRRRDRRRRPRRPRARLRRPAAAHPPGRVAGPPAGRRDPGVVRRLRPAGPRRRRPARTAARASAASGCCAALRPGAAGPPHAGQHRPRPAAEDWFGRFEGAGLDGVVAKRLDDPYQPDKRALVKVKHERTADCVVAGYRIHKDGNGVGSLLLGLYDDDGQLHHVGVAAAFTRQVPRRAAGRARAADPRRRRRPPVAATGPSGSSTRRRPHARRRRAAGTPARTCRGCRSASSGWPR